MLWLPINARQIFEMVNVCAISLSFLGDRHFRRLFTPFCCYCCYEYGYTNGDGYLASFQINWPGDRDNAKDKEGVFSGERGRNRKLLIKREFIDGIILKKAKIRICYHYSYSANETG